MGVVLHLALDPARRAEADAAAARQRIALELNRHDRGYPAPVRPVAEPVAEAARQIELAMRDVRAASQALSERNLDTASLELFSAIHGLRRALRSLA